jgi:hypothetical protein
MIASAKRMRQMAVSACYAKFLSLLPKIRDQACFAFRTEKPERRQELIAEVVANCWVAFVRLVERGLLEVVYPTPLAQYAIKQVRDGRRVGAKLNVRDVSSALCCSPSSSAIMPPALSAEGEPASGQVCCPPDRHLETRRLALSHLVSIRTEVRDAAAVRTACQRLRLPQPIQGAHRLFTSSVTGPDHVNAGRT